MGYGPIQKISTPFEDYPNYWLKGYEQGTSTPLAMATDSTGATTIARAEISGGGAVPIGFIKTVGDVIFIPHFSQAYDLFLFPTAAEADANDTSNAVQVADNIDSSTADTIGSTVILLDTVSAMVARDDLVSGVIVDTTGYTIKGGVGAARYLIQNPVEFGGTPDEKGDHTLTNGNIAVLQIDGIIDLFQYGVDPDGTHASNKAAIEAALARTDFDVIRQPFADAAIDVGSNIAVTNGKRIIFDSEYMGEPLFADPDRGWIGDGLASVLVTDVYPGGSNTNRQLRFDNIRIRNTNFPCIQLQDSDDAKLHDPHLNTTESEALRIRFSARVQIMGAGQLSSTFASADDDNFAIKAYDNCNGLYVSPGTKITGGANGGAIDVSKCQKLEIFGIIESARSGVRVGGYSGDDLTAWATATAYVVGDEVQQNNSAYVCAVDHTSGTFSTDLAAGRWIVINGNCNGVKISCYMEAVEKPFSYGARDIVLGLDMDGTYLGNTNATAPSYVVELGKVVGWKINSNSFNKKGTEPTLLITKPTTGSSVADFILGGKYSNNHQQGGGSNFTIDGSVGTADQATIFAKNQFEFDQAPLTGVEEVYFSSVITANIGTNIDEIIPSANGGRITSVEILQKSGTITCTLQIGYSGNVAENLSVDPETLSYSANRADATLTTDLMRPSEGTRLRVIAGAGTGTFRVRVKYRN